MSRQSKENFYRFHALDLKIDRGTEGRKRIRLSYVDALSIIVVIPGVFVIQSSDCIYV